MDNRAATEGGPYLGFVGVALRGGPAWASPNTGYAFFRRSPYGVFVSSGKILTTSSYWQTASDSSRNTTGI